MVYRFTEEQSPLFTYILYHNRFKNESTFCKRFGKQHKKNTEDVPVVIITSRRDHTFIKCSSQIYQLIFRDGISRKIQFFQVLQSI